MCHSDQFSIFHSVVKDWIVMNSAVNWINDRCGLTRSSPFGVIDRHTIYCCVLTIERTPNKYPKLRIAIGHTQNTERDNVQVSPGTKFKQFPAARPQSAPCATYCYVASLCIFRHRCEDYQALTFSILFREQGEHPETCMWTIKPHSHLDCFIWRYFNLAKCISIIVKNLI